MAKERKIICDCGHGFEEVTDVFDGIKAKVLRYPNCGYTTFSLEQAKEFVKLKEMRKLVKQERLSR